MSVRRFKADLGSAAAKALRGEIPGVTGISKGDSDGEAIIIYRHDTIPDLVRVRALAEDPSEYPDGNNFILFTDSANPPPEVMTAMSLAQEYLLSITVTDMVEVVAKFLNSAFDPQATPGDLPGDGRDEEDEAITDLDDTMSCDGSFESDDTDFDDRDAEHFGLASLEKRQQHSPKGKPHTHLTPLFGHIQQRIKSDLRMARQAGYRVGVYDDIGSLSPSGTVSISIRVNKLDLSEEALMAWNVSETDYVVLLIRYESQYRPLEKVLDSPAAQPGVQLRIGLCTKYKPSTVEAAEAFSNPDKVREGPAIPKEPDHAFRPMFLSASLNRFMNESLSSLIKLRLGHNASWDAANEILLHNSRQAMAGMALLDYEFLPSEDKLEGSGAAQGIAAAQEELHPVLGPDHLVEASQTRSLPLIAMQFAMRYFARCTQYCLRCHRKVDEDFEALRPYVCSNPLCLFQYMTMGLGPDVEHEILTEPSVVDLLVSLCYASLQKSNSVHTGHLGYHTGPNIPIREFPVGLPLRVPNLFVPQPGRPEPISVKLDGYNISLTDSSNDVDFQRLTVNQWVVLRSPVQAPDTYTPFDLSLGFRADTARITAIFPQERRATFELMSPYGKPEEALARLPSVVRILPYELDFDNLTIVEKSVVMQYLLNTVPPISKIREYLSRHPNKSLRCCKGVSPAAATLLRWIVSSNRSCINEIGTIDNPESLYGPHTTSLARRWTVKEKRRKEYIPGMDGYIQFRFSQGPPDKEVRFNKALQEVAQRKDLSRHPTIFAWHGSDVANWHSILRTGLDFKDINYGRAFGDGVYFSPFFTTSSSYTASAAVSGWPSSVLNVRSVLSLNEIINAPHEFRSHSPHYVVQHQDWHQCRYLFVSSSPTSGGVNLNIMAGGPLNLNTNTGGDLSLEVNTADDGNNKAIMLQQAPRFEVRGPTNYVLQIPVASMPPRAASPGHAGIPGTSRRIVLVVAGEDSDESSSEDLEVLAPDRHDGPTQMSGSSNVDTTLATFGEAPPTPDEFLTDFRPGTLDLTTLPRLQAPAWATPTSSRALGRELRKLQATQSSTPMHELGWYIDFEAVSNMFQWIVELHSFDASLPLAQDMKKAGVTSIVTEFRFGQDWPMTPPFVRVIRPRFLPFQEGGGGHVTLGGAMCMELLTNSGWTPANSMESVILQVRMALCSDERGARLDRPGSRNRDYSIDEAVDAYNRAVLAHGWEVPKDFQATAFGGQAPNLSRTA